MQRIVTELFMCGQAHQQIDQAVHARAEACQQVHLDYVYANHLLPQTHYVSLLVAQQRALAIGIPCIKRDSVCMHSYMARRSFAGKISHAMEDLGNYAKLEQPCKTLKASAVAGHASVGKHSAGCMVAPA